MLLSEILPNVLAMISSLIATVMLSIVASKIGGSIGNMLKLLIAGIFFSVFIHSGVEMAETFDMISQTDLMPIMGMLLTIGSIFFIISGFVGLKALK